MRFLDRLPSLFIVVEEGGQYERIPIARFVEAWRFAERQLKAGSTFHVCALGLAWRWDARGQPHGVVHDFIVKRLGYPPWRRVPARWGKIRKFRTPAP